MVDKNTDEDVLARFARRGVLRRSLLLKKYLCIDKDEEEHPVLLEYLGLALSFTAVGVLIRRTKERKTKARSRKAQKVALVSVLKAAMAKLRGLAHKAIALEANVKPDSEHSNLVRRLAEAEMVVKEMKRRRSEDAKANEKVMAMLSLQEHGWRNERKRLRGEIELLKKELAEQSSGSLRRELKKEESLSEEARTEQVEKTELMVDSLKNREQAQLRRLETELSKAVLERDHAETLNTKLSTENKLLEKQTRDQEQVISTFVKRNELLRTENSKLFEELNYLQQLKFKPEKLSNGEADVHRMYMEQIAVLENQVAVYQSKVTRLEDSALLRLTDGVEDKQIIVPARRELVAAQNLLAQYMQAEREREAEVAKWRKLYMAAKITLDMLQSSNVSFHDQQYPAAAKTQISAELVERHSVEMDSVERHLKAKDERMEALRKQLVCFEKELGKKELEIRELKAAVEQTAEMKQRAEMALQSTREELEHCLENLSRLTQTNLKAVATKKRTRHDDVPEPSFRGPLETREPDSRIMLLESELLELRAANDRQRKSQESLVTEVLKEKMMLEKLLEESVQESVLRTAIASACWQVEKLSCETVSNVGSQIVQAQNEIGVQDLMQQAAQEPEEAKLDFDEVKSCTALAVVKTVPQVEGEGSLRTLQGDQQSMDELEAPKKDTNLTPLLKRQLRKYRGLLQRINALADQVAQAKSGSTEPGLVLNSSFLPRVLELQEQVNGSRQRLASLQNIDKENQDEFDKKESRRVLTKYIEEIQKRLELKVGSLMNELKSNKTRII